MDRFQIANISYKIDGYFSMHMQEIGLEYRMPKFEEAFEQAKQELINNMNTELKNIKSLTSNQFKASKAKDFK